MSIYASSTLGTASDLLQFNGTTFPIYRVVSRAPQRRDVRELDLNLPFENGISDFITLVGKMAYIIEGVMYPGSEADYDNGLRALRKIASLELSQADNLSDTGYVPYIFTEHDQTKQIFVKVLYVDIPENTRKGLVQPFRLVCKVKDPSIFGTTLQTASTQGSNPTTATGTAIFAFSYPIIWGASTYSVSNVITNNGDLNAYPQSITVYGPVNTPTITNTTTGEYITVSQNLSTISNILSITYDKDSLSVTLDGNSVLSSVTSASTYFKIHPGANTITLTGSSIGSGAYVVVTAYDTYPLS